MLHTWDSFPKVNTSTLTSIYHKLPEESQHETRRLTAQTVRRKRVYVVAVFIKYLEHNFVFATKSYPIPE